MDATLHAVERRPRQFDVGPSSFDNFDFGAAERVPAERALDPGWTLYCVNVARRQALFLEIPADADLAAAPFVFTMQEHLARRALVVPFEALPRLAAAVPEPRRIVLVFNIARCGSTLVNAMLNGVEGVWALSEPDAFFDLAMSRHLLDRAELRRLIGACARLCFRPPAGRAADTMAFKLRAQSLFQAEDFHAALPGAACVFLYRDGVGWARSFWYFLQNLGVPLRLNGEMLRFHWWIMSAAADFELLRPWLDADGTVPVERTLAPIWAMHVETYLRGLDAGLPFLALGYGELEADHEGAARKLLRHAGLPESAAAGAVAAFGRDSQEGTVFARDRRDVAPFTAAAEAEFRRALARATSLAPDVVLRDAGPANPARTPGGST